MITVYFDTSFYVLMAKDNNIQIEQTIDELNHMEVRHVVSMPIFNELFSSKHRYESNRRLYARVSKFSIPPLNLNDGLSWKALLAPCQDLDEHSEFLRTIDDHKVVAYSHSLVANRSLTNKQQELWNKSNPQFAAIANNENGSQDSIYTSLLQKIIQDISLALTLHNPGIDLKMETVIEMLKAPNPDFSAIQNKIQSGIPKDCLARTTEHRKIYESVTVTDNRPFDVAVGKATPKQQKRLANTLRDGTHMSLFAEYADSIDFLQVDGAQMEQILKSSPQHRISELGLAKRCFTLNSIDDAAKKIRNLVKDGNSRTCS